MATKPATKITIQTLDLNFRGQAGAIAAYLIPHAHGAVLIECGPASTLPALQAGLQSYGLDVSDVTDVLLTHIHLDHAGAAGWLARRGARVHVHPFGAPHLLNPEKLLASAERIYGDQMTELWGEFLPVPAERLSVVEDNQVIEIEGLRFTALDTPGHAYHHHVYLFQDVCFSGDIGGVRIGGVRHLRMPMPPPEFHLELWRESLQRLQTAYTLGDFKRIAPTHFGIYDDPDWHLKAARQALDEVEYWMLRVMPQNPPMEELKELFVAWARERSLRYGVNPHLLDPLEAANPSWMSAYGIQRYWNKVRNPA
jgi:glyoxylase-like metal-dependent hydrolase (beta-lactamase superfamily II)